MEGIFCGSHFFVRIHYLAIRITSRVRVRSFGTKEYVFLHTKTIYLTQR